MFFLSIVDQEPTTPENKKAAYWPLYYCAYTAALKDTIFSGASLSYFLVCCIALNCFFVGACFGSVLV